MNMVSTGSFNVAADELETKSKTVKQFLAEFEEKNRRTMRAGGVSFMALSLAACGGGSSSSVDDGDGETGGGSDPVTTTVLTTGQDNASDDIVTGHISMSNPLNSDTMDLSTYTTNDVISAGHLEITVNDLHMGAVSDNLLLLLPPEFFFEDPEALYLLLQSADIAIYEAGSATVVDTPMVTFVDDNGEDVLLVDAGDWDDSVQHLTLETAEDDSSFALLVENLTLNSDTFTLSTDPMGNTGSGDFGLFDFPANGLFGIPSVAWVNDAALEGFTAVHMAIITQGEGETATASHITIADESGVTDIDISAGRESHAELHMHLEDFGIASSGPADVGPVTMDLDIDTQKFGAAEFYFGYRADGSNTADVRDLNIVGYDVDLAQDSNGYHTGDILGEDAFGFSHHSEDGNHVHLDLDALGNLMSDEQGHAAIGDINITGVTVDGGVRSTFEMHTSANVRMDIANDNSNDGATGYASIGDTTIGNVDVVMGKSAAFEWSRDFDAYILGDNDTLDEGTASIGDTTIGDITIEIGDYMGNLDGEDQMDYYSVYHTSFAENDVVGDASIGNLTVGDVKVTIGDHAREHANHSFYQSAYAETGNADVGNITFGDIDLTIGNHGEGIGLYQSATISVSEDGDATVGDTMVGDITVTVGDDHSGSIYVTHSQEATVQGDGDAKIGDLVVGDIDYMIGSSVQYIYHGLFGSAEANGEGDADVGDLTVGDTKMTIGDDFYMASAWHGIEAHAEDGDATVGDVVLGLVDITAGNGFALHSWNNASADAVSGDATAGDFTIDDITLSMGDTNGQDSYVLINHDAYVEDDGNAEVGYMDVGNVSLTTGDSPSGESYIDIQHRAENDDGTGNATIGTTTILDVDLVAGDGRSEVNIDITIDAEADDDGIATVGNVSIGNVSLTSGTSDGDESGINIDITADGYNEADLGTVTIGNIYGDFGGGEDTAEFVDVNIEAESFMGDADVSEVMVGTRDISSADGYLVFLANDLDIKAEAVFDITNGTPGSTSWQGEGDATISDVTILDASMTVGGVVYEEAFGQTQIDAYGENATIGDISLGMFDYSETEGADVADVEIYRTVNAVAVNGVAQIGDINDPMLVAVSHEDHHAVSFGGTSIVTTANDINIVENVWATAYTGGLAEIGNGVALIGDVDLGDLKIEWSNDSGITGFATRSVYAYGEDIRIGNVDFGNIDIDLAGGAALRQNLYVSASADTFDSFVIGDMAVGNIDITVSDTADYNGNFAIDFNNPTRFHEVGDVTIGNIHSHVVDSGNAYWAFNMDGNFNSGGTYIEVGTVTVGDITLSGTSAYIAEQDTNNTVFIDISADSVDGETALTIGDISITAAGQQEALVSFDVNVNDSDGDVQLGNIHLEVSDNARADLYGDLYSFGSAGNGEDIGYDMDAGQTVTMIGLNDATTADGAGVSIYLEAGGHIGIGDVTISGTSFGDAEWVGPGTTVTYSGATVLTSEGYWDFSTPGDGLLAYSLNNLIELSSTDNGWTYIGDIDLSGVSHFFNGVNEYGVEVDDIVGPAEVGINVDTLAYGHVGDIILGDTGMIVTVRDEYTGDITLGDGPDTVVVSLATGSGIGIGTKPWEGAGLESLSATADMEILNVGISDVLVFEVAGNDGVGISSVDAVTFEAFIEDADFAHGEDSVGDGEDVYVGKVGDEYFVSVDTDDNGQTDYVVRLDGDNIDNTVQSIYDQDNIVAETTV